MKVFAAAALVAGALALPASPAFAQACPNSSMSTVTGTAPAPSYTYTRGGIVSFDGTPIVYNLFEPLNPAPRSIYSILEGPGWGGAGSTSPDSNLIREGYAELTWDPRGFGESGGVAEVDSPASEGRDVSALIEQVLTGRPEIAVDKAGEGDQPRYHNDIGFSNTFGQPVVGMAGGSYGGGIQLSAAAFDGRIKAIVPSLAWNDLNYSLWPGNVIKLGWGELLYGAGLGTGTASHVQGDASGFPNGGDGGNQTGGYDPMIHYAESTGTALGYPDGTVRAWFHQRSFAEYGAGPAGHYPDVPTLMTQGNVDTLFNLTDAWNNKLEINGHDPDVPVKFIAFCGGHVSCPTGAPPAGANYSSTAPATSPIGDGQSAGQYTEARTIDWFNHYLRGENASGEHHDGMPSNVVYQDETGAFHGLETFPTPEAPGPATYVSKPFTGTLVGHGVPNNVSPGGATAAEADGATNSSDPGQVTVPVFTAPAGHAVPIVGIGRATAKVTVNGAATELFFRLIDKSTGGV